VEQPAVHGSVSGSFKNAIDWLHLLGDHDPPYLTDQVVGLVTTAGGTQGCRPSTAWSSSSALRAWAVPLVLPVAQAWRAFDEDGRVRDDIVGVSSPPWARRWCAPPGRWPRTASATTASRGSSQTSALAASELVGQRPSDARSFVARQDGGVFHRFASALTDFDSRPPRGSPLRRPSRISRSPRSGRLGTRTGETPDVTAPRSRHGLRQCRPALTGPQALGRETVTTWLNTPIQP
jgi:hypothetical protein